MRKEHVVVMIILCFLGLFSCSILPVHAEEVEKDKKEIVVSGEAEVSVEPDRVKIFLGIETLAKTVDVAREENAVKIKKALNAIKLLNISGLTIEAPSYNVSIVKEDEYNARKAGRLPQIIGYKVKQDFDVIIENNDVEKLSNDAAKVIDTALNNDVNMLDYVTFYKEDDSEHTRKALKLAVKNAISNAKVIADTAGVSIKEYTNIRSYFRGYYPRRFNYEGLLQREAKAGAPMTPTTLVAGKLKINCNVELHCSIE